MVPVGRLVLLRSIAKSDLVSAMAYLTVPALIRPVAGPPLGASSPPISTGGGSSGSMCRSACSACCSSLKFIDNLREEAVPRFDFRGFCSRALAL